MFGEIVLDITDKLRKGKNVIAVRVDDKLKDIKDGDKLLDVAISVEITRNMLHAFPHGMLRDNPAGIWQPVSGSRSS